MKPGVEEEADRGSVGSSVLRLVFPPSQGDAVAVAAPRWLNTLSAASVPFIPVSPPNSVFKAEFLTVQCLFSVPVARAAVNRLFFLEATVFVWFCFSRFVLSASGAVSAARATGTRASCQSSSAAGKCHGNRD